MTPFSVAQDLLRELLPAPRKNRINIIPKLAAIALQRRIRREDLMREDLMRTCLGSCFGGRQ
jgi:predicted deacylase